MTVARAVVVAGGVALFIAACGLGEDTDPLTGAGPPPTEPGRPAQEGVPPEVEDAAHEWPMAGRDYEHTRATTDSPIDAETVDDLGIAWSLPLPDAGEWGAAASAPLILDGTVYFQDLMSNVYAIDFETGDIEWLQEYQLSALGPNGPAVGWGKVYIQDGMDNLIALDLEDGEELWRTTLWPQTGVHQPYVYDGYVYTGTGAGEPLHEEEEAVGREGYAGGTSGVAYGVDAETGRIAWSFQVVEEDFWGDPELNSGGALWYPPSVDTERELTFWGTGNPAPFPGTLEYPNASSRPGPNLYSNSVIALDGHSGDLVWYEQVHPADLFDLDYQGGPVLVTADVDGQGRDLAIGWGKLGILFAFDRDTGQVVWERSVGKHENYDLDEVPPGEEVLVYPGIWGGIETPVAYAEGVLYVPTNNMPTPYTATGHDAEDPGAAVAEAEGRTRLEEGEGIMVALDAGTGEVLWESHTDAPLYAGATVVNDVVFTSTLDGRIHGYAADDGALLWEKQAPGGINAWPAVAGDTIIWPVGVGRDPQLIALRLDGE